MRVRLSFWAVLCVDTIALTDEHDNNKFLIVFQYFLSTVSDEYLKLSTSKTWDDNSRNNRYS